jgi:hypothetical protein
LYRGLKTLATIKARRAAIVPDFLKKPVGVNWLRFPPRDFVGEMYNHPKIEVSHQDSIVDRMNCIAQFGAACAGIKNQQESDCDT